MSAENRVEKAIDLDAIRRRHAARVTYREESHTSAPPAEKDAADLLALLDEAVGYLNWLNTSHDNTPDMRILRRAVAAFLARFPTPSPTEEEKT